MVLYFFDILLQNTRSALRSIFIVSSIYFILIRLILQFIFTGNGVIFKQLSCLKLSGDKQVRTTLYQEGENEKEELGDQVVETANL